MKNGSILNMQHLGFYIDYKKNYFSLNFVNITELPLLQRSLMRLNLLLSCESDLIDEGTL